jgi:hypothetical protein
MYIIVDIPSVVIQLKSSKDFHGANIYRMMMMMR